MRSVRVSGKSHSSLLHTATIAVDHLLLHQGVVPNVNLAMAAGLEHRWDEGQLCWTPVLKPFGASSVPGIYVVGDGAGIAGAQAAAWRGVLSASDIVHTVNPEAADKAAKFAASALRRTVAKASPA